MPSPFPVLAPCILIHADLTVYVDMVLIMATEFSSFRRRIQLLGIFLLTVNSHCGHDILQGIYTL